ncbi:MAG TPA: hypothetical protein VLZ50_11240, partial [Terracidiphilus sp.]|nr:hypothetical protein [Terracidiphilus sp.]
EPEQMNLVKSIGVALLFIVVGLLITFLGGLAYLLMVLPPLKENEAIGWDPISFARSPLSWVIVLVSFALGFAWEYRRLLHR